MGYDNGNNQGYFRPGIVVDRDKSHSIKIFLDAGNPIGQEVADHYVRREANSSGLKNGGFTIRNYLIGGVSYVNIIPYGGK